MKKVIGLHIAQRAHNALAHACENLVEEGAMPERLEAMKVAHTHAMGRAAYQDFVLLDLPIELTAFVVR